MTAYERQRRYNRRQAAEVADVGELPLVVNPERRERCRLDLELALITYFPASTGLSKFSSDHRRVIGRVQGCVLDGGLFAQAVYRGFAKTTIAENTLIWATLYGHRRFGAIFGADAEAAAGNIDSIKLELSENDLLFEDFPETCAPIRALEGKPQRCASQTYNGELTHIGWTSDELILPLVKVPRGWGSIEGHDPNGELVDSSGGGAILTARGIMGGCRGMKHKRPDGTQQRPDFVLLDDPQTDASAATSGQVNKRLSVIRKSILRLGGHNKKIAVVMNATVIEPDDLVEQIFNKKKFPAWQCERIKMVRAFSEAHETLWLTDYKRIRDSYKEDLLGDQDRAVKEANAFYKAHRAEMDAGCEVSWEQCYDRETEISAIQHAYNILVDDGPEVFASECQNEPVRQKDEDELEILSADAIAARVNGLPRGAAPLAVTKITAFVDVQKFGLPWIVAGFGDGFTGFVLDYGFWPEQSKKYYQRKDIRRTMQKVTGKSGLEEALLIALETIVGELAAREFKRDDGAVMKIERCLVDANWGPQSDTVYSFCRQSNHSAILTPSHGHYIGAKNRPFSDWKKRDGERTGLNWRMPLLQNRRSARYVIYDTNFWKGFFHQRLMVTAGARGSLTLFGDKPEEHQLLADHWTAEKATEVEANGRRVMEFTLKPSRPDNDWLDGIAGCHVGASMEGIKLITTVVKKKKRRRLSEIENKRTV